MKILKYGDCPKHGKFPLEIIEDGEIFPRYNAYGCEKCGQERELAKRFKKSLIPDRFINQTFDTYKVQNQGQKSAKEIVMRFTKSIIENPQGGQSLILLGLPGNGKTHLAIACAKECMRSSKMTSLFTSTYKIIRNIRECWTNHDRSEKEVYDEYIKADLLIIDEVGVQNGSENERNILFQIINDRYESNRPNIIISNLDLAGIRSFLGYRSFDRLKDNGAVVVFDWESFRKSQGV